MEKNEDQLLLEYIESLEWRNKLLSEALQLAGKYAREYPPAHFPDGEDSELHLTILIDGYSRDPDGKEYMALWLNQAKNKI